MSTLSYTKRNEAVPADPKRFARSLFTLVLESVNVPRRMRECFQLDNQVLRVGEATLDLTNLGRVLLAAIGKAAVPMAEHALAILRPQYTVKGVVVGVGPWERPDGIVYFEGGHPVPDANSFAAARALIDLLQTADEQTLVVFLISGGASAMAEAPLDISIKQEELIAFYRALLHSGLPIAKTNALRKHLSAIKGGRLALACSAATRCTILISDVPPKRTDVVGSGPSLADTSTVAECRQLLAETPSLCAALSPSLKGFFQTVSETPKSLPEVKQASVIFSALSSDSLLQSAERITREAGYRVIIDNTTDDWDYRSAAAYLLERARTEAEQGLPVCILSAGEVTVSIPGRPGQGGRNQQWALEVARLISGSSGYVAMSAGSDGIDGNSPAAGAIVDESTWQRAIDSGIDPQSALDSFDTYPLFAHLGDAVMPGASGNNLRDLRVILVHPMQLPQLAEL